MLWYIVEWIQDRNLQQKPGGQNHAGTLFFGSLLGLHQDHVEWAFLCMQDHLPTDGTNHSGLGFPASVTSQENLSQTRP